MSEWDLTELTAWAFTELNQHGATPAECAEVQALLTEHEVDGEVLEHLGAEDLVDLGIAPRLAEELAASIVEAAPNDWRGPNLRDEQGRRLSTIMHQEEQAQALAHQQALARASSLDAKIASLR